VAGVAVELAFRRYLSENDIPYEVVGAVPFTDPERYDVSLGGHRCDIKSFLITHRDQITEMRKNPGVLLDAPALVASDQHAGEGHSDQDLYIFAFLAGLVAASQEDLKKAVAAGKPYYLVHAMPKEWCRPKTWRPLGPVTLKSESEAPLTVEIGGQDEGRGFLTRIVELPPRTRVTIAESFYAVASIHVQHPTEARLGIHSSQMKETHVIHPLDWGNIWVHGMEIFLAGYLSRDGFRRSAELIAQGTRVFQYEHTKTKNLAVKIAELRPLADLFARVREWHADESDDRT
jgi:hypothetical protein